MGRIVASIIATVAVVAVVFAVATEVSASVGPPSRRPLETFTSPVPNHPGAAEAIARFFGSPAYSQTVTTTIPFSVTAELVTELHEQGVGFGEIFRAIHWAILSGKPVTEVVQLHESGLGWGEIRKELDLDKRQAKLSLGKALHEFRKGEQAEGKARRGKPAEHEPDEATAPAEGTNVSSAGSTTAAGGKSDEHRAQPGGKSDDHRADPARGKSGEHRSDPGGKSGEHRSDPGGKSGDHRADSGKAGPSGQTRKK